MDKRILITGSNGLLGQKLISSFRLKNEIFATSIGPCRINDKSGFIYKDLDLTDKDSVYHYIKKINPDAIINAAAMTNVDACEDDREYCNKLNISAVKYLADICAEVNAHLIHISTDFIFDGKNGPYKETDIANPLNHYGLSKWKSEQFLQNHCCTWTILRTNLVYGIADNLNKDNIVLWGRSALKKGKPLNVIDDQFRSPTLAEDLAQACVLTIQKGVQGIFNISGREIMSIFEMVERMADFYACDKSIINRVSTNILNQRAIRPKKTGLILDKAIKEIGYSPHTFEQGLSIIEEKILELYK